MENMTGDWILGGLPEEYTLVEFMIGQEGSDLSGTLGITGPNGELVYSMTGTHIDSNVKMSFVNKEEGTDFSFSGEFETSWFVRGTLTGQFTGLGILEVNDN